MTLHQLDKLSSIALSVISTFAIITGGIFGLVEYMGHKEDLRKSASLNLVTNYHSDVYLKNTEKLQNIWSNHYPNLIILSNDNILHNKEKIIAYNKFVIEMVSKESISQEIINILNFYERVAICVEAQLCDKEVIDNFFLNDGRTFFNKFYPYICALRNQWQDNKLWFKPETYFKPGITLCN
ncbi:protein of unknown function [Nitrosomonas ureae]|uniref:Uncharacterized protein n=1 Tax=Nitrosomonas ureae TaxID=44577 RepID=A0A285BWT2_9PROT|nr:DUF4760 domain-containing protein [Nitrosomonas ureae]SNX59303.1 protein of unknown function [Nitrosomonas ureae]